MNPVKVGLLELVLIATAYICWLLMRPFWAEVLFFSTMTPYWVRQWLGERFGWSVGSCRHCGYNLKANESGVCPECGEPAEAVTPVREVERPPGMWAKWLVTTGVIVVGFVGAVVVILMW